MLATFWPSGCTYKGPAATASHKARGRGRQQIHQGVIMPRFALLGSTIISLASLTLAQTNLPSTTPAQTNSFSTAPAEADSPSTINPQDTRPRLEFEPRLNLNGGGFQPVSGSMTAGTGMEDDHLAWHVFGTYDAATKATYEVGNSPSTYAIISNPHGNI